MASSLIWILILCLVLPLFAVSDASPHDPSLFVGINGGVKRLFVFGDSYADTGNIGIAESAYSSKQPYGMTYTGTPTGRWSDGRIMPDFIAGFLGLPSPVASSHVKENPLLQQFGVNFAYGGTGVFSSWALPPTMDTQINGLQQMVNDGEYKDGFADSIALVSYAGNDYTKFIASHSGNIAELNQFTLQVVEQLVNNVKRLKNMGFGKVAVTTIPPSGCLPINTRYNGFQACDPKWVQTSTFHNDKLREAVAGITDVVVVDTYSAMLSVAQNEFSNSLRPCCIGVDENSVCGSVDGSGKPLYTVCPVPSGSLFWDMYHPTQAGWAAITAHLQPSIRALLR